MKVRIGLIPVVFLCLCAPLTGCGDDDGGNNVNHNNNDNNNNTNDDTVYQMQDESDPNFIEEGATVRLEGVIVTAVDEYGQYTGNVFVQEPNSGPYSGVLLYNPDVTDGTLADLSLGYVVNVSGEKDEFALPADTSGQTMTEVVAGNIELVAQAQPLDPEIVASPQTIMTHPDAEPYEGVLVAVRNVRRIEVDSYGDVRFSGGLAAANDLMDVAAVTTDGSCYAQITGMLNYFFAYKLLPRVAGDIELAQDQSVCAQVADEVCDDGVDNDEDGYTDCGDFDCNGDPACAETVCDDNVDNDGDGYTDCADFDCQNLGNCRENDASLCTDNIDNDGDQLTDCDDWSCRMHPDLLAIGLCGEETGDASCADGVDNDGDGYIDCLDWSCWYNPAVTICETTLADCTDATDNEGDGYTDCADYSCQYSGVCSDVESTPAQCNDGVDNDSDGYTDCGDNSCARSVLVDYCEGNVYTCSDGIDNDGDGYADCADFGCRACNYNYWSPVCEPCP